MLELSNQEAVIYVHTQVFKGVRTSKAIQ